MSVPPVEEAKVMNNIAYNLRLPNLFRTLSISPIVKGLCTEIAMEKKPFSSI
jgi:hypothetical protein